MTSKWAKEGKWEQALGLAGSIEKFSYRAIALSAVAAEMAKAGRVDEAKRLFNEAEQTLMAEREDWAFGYGLTELLKALWEAGWQQEAERVANEAIKLVQQKITDTCVRVEVLTRLAELMAEKGKLVEAKKCLELEQKRLKEIQYADLLCSVIGKIAKVLILMRQRQEAEKSG